MYQGDGFPDDAMQWLISRLGHVQSVQACRAGSQRTGVWHLQSDSGDHYFKINRRRIRWGTELFFYSRFAHAFGASVPKLIDVYQENETHGLLITALDGIPMREMSLSASQSLCAYERAGELCRQMHDLAEGPWFGIMDHSGQPTDDAGQVLPEGTCDPIAYYTEQIERSLAAAKKAKAIQRSEELTASNVIESLGKMTFQRPVLTSWDYTPGNWIVDRNGRLIGIIDFENMAWGLRADPLTRLLVDYFPHCAGAKDAFHMGYGQHLLDDFFDQVRMGCLLYGLWYLTYGTNNANPVSIERGHVALRACSSATPRHGETVGGPS